MSAKFAELPLRNRCLRFRFCGQTRIDTVGEDSNLKDVYDTERQLLYVACTRARDVLLVTGVERASEFLDDLRA